MDAMLREDDTCPYPPSITGLPKYQLRLAITTAIIDGIKLERIVDTLFREGVDDVSEFYHDIKHQRSAMDAVSRWTTFKDQRRSPLTRNRMGTTLREMAQSQGIRRSTLVSLLVHHGFLELVPYGGSQSRMLVTETAFHGEFGHNVLPASRIGRLEGFHRSCIFPVFYPERLPEVLWCLDYEGIKKGVSDQEGKRKRLSWLLSNHPYLPNEELSELAGYSLSGIEKARSRVSVSL